MKRRTFLGGAMAVAVVGQGSRALAQQPPIKIGMSMPQTGGLAGGGKASLLGIEIWRDDINAKGGLLGRKVELVVYDDKSSASETPAIYSKLVDVDKVDLLFAPYATVPTAPIMPFVKQLRVDRRRLGCAALVVIDDQFDLAAEQPAFGVDVVAPDLDAEQRGLAPGRKTAGLRHGHADLDRRLLRQCA